MKDEDKKELASMVSYNKNPASKIGYWTEERLVQLADDLTDWSKRKDSIILSEFGLERDMGHLLVYKLCEISSYFKRAFLDAKCRIGKRREKGAMVKKLDPRVYMFTARSYDVELDRDINEQLGRDELVKAHAKIKALQQDINDKGEILKYLKMQKEIDTLVGE
jgi:hypothetical protein